MYLDSSLCGRERLGSGILKTLEHFHNLSPLFYLMTFFLIFLSSSSVFHLTSSLGSQFHVDGDDDDEGG